MLSPDKPFLSPPLILCAEDQDDLRTDICDELREAGYRVLEAVNGEETLSQIQAAAPDLILCDISMPECSGYDVLGELRTRRPDLADTPFIFLTALSTPDEVVKGKRLGADDYLIKPVDFDLLLATVSARLRQVQRMRHKAVHEVNELREAMSNLRIQATTQAFEGVTRALNLIAPGVVLLDDQGQVLFANRSAYSLACDANGLQLGDTLVSTSPTQAQPLRYMIRSVLAATSEQEATCLRLTRQNDRHDLLLIACSINSQPNDDLPIPQPAAVILLADPEQRAHLPQEMIARLFGLTPTEAMIALALAEGLRTEQIAARMEVSATTVAFHLRNLFQKTNTHRQAELITVILTATMTVALEEQDSGES